MILYNFYHSRSQLAFLSLGQSFEDSLLQNISDFTVQRFLHGTDGFYSYEEFATRFKIRDFSWKAFFESIDVFRPERLKIYVSDVSKVTDFARSMDSAREKLINIGIWRSLEEKLLISHQLTYGNECQEEFCLDFTGFKFPWLLHDLYIDHYFDPFLQKQVEKIFTEQKNVLASFILQQKWLSLQAKEIAMDRIRK